MSRADNERPARVARSVQVSQHVYNARIVTVYSLQAVSLLRQGGKGRREGQEGREERGNDEGLITEGP